MREAMIIDGKAIAARVRARVKAAVERYVDERGDAPGLATVLVGDDEASHVYVRGKHKACQDVGIRSIGHELPKDVAQEDLLALVDELNQDAGVHGIIVQLPL